MKICITGFDPFGGEKINPAFEAVKLLPDEILGNPILKYEIPTVFHKSIEKVKEILEAEKPDIFICVGQAGGRFDLTVERVAINLDDARIGDNEGNQPIDEPIISHGEAAYFATVPIKAMVQEIRKNGIPASVSNTAGTFVCNHIMYGLLYHLKKSHPNARGGFIHVPFLGEQVLQRPNTPYMSVEDIKKGLEASILACVLYQEDISLAEGKTH